MKYKIISVDNFDRESVSDVLVCENITSQLLGEKMLAALNAGANDYSDCFYKLVDQEHKLYEYNP